MTWRPTAPSTTPCAPVFDERQIFASTTTWASPRCKTCLPCALATPCLSPLWRREHIANIQITIAEDLGVEKRGAFTKPTGALRDMVQNHALQLLCAIAWSPHQRPRRRHP